MSAIVDAAVAPGGRSSNQQVDARFEWRIRSVKGDMRRWLNRVSPDYTLHAYLLLVVCLGLIMLPTLVAADKGTFVRKYVTGSGMSQRRHIVVSDRGYVHEIVTVGNCDCLPGDLLIKVPGELVCRKAPWTDLDRVPRWFEFGVSGDLKAGVVLILFLMAHGCWEWMRALQRHGQKACPAASL